MKKLRFIQMLALLVVIVLSTSFGTSAFADDEPVLQDPLKNGIQFDDAIKAACQNGGTVTINGTVQLPQIEPTTGTARYVVTNNVIIKVQSNTTICDSKHDMLFDIQSGSLTIQKDGDSDVRVTVTDSSNTYTQKPSVICVNGGSLELGENVTLKAFDCEYKNLVTVTNDGACTLNNNSRLIQESFPSSIPESRPPISGCAALKIDGGTVTGEYTRITSETGIGVEQNGGKCVFGYDTYGFNGGAGCVVCGNDSALKLCGETLKSSFSEFYANNKTIHIQKGASDIYATLNSSSSYATSPLSNENGPYCIYGEILGNESSSNCVITLGSSEPSIMNKYEGDILFRTE